MGFKKHDLKKILHYNVLKIKIKELKLFNILCHMSN